MPLVTVAEVYLGQASGVIFTLGTITTDVMDGSYSLKVNTDEMTNTGSGGWRENVGTTKEADGQVTVAWRSVSPPPWKVNGIYALVIDNNGANYLSGNVRITQMDFPAGKVKEGIKISMSWMNEGSMIDVHP